ncbi:MAG: putative metalloprotease CJM1_0395 family protein, partial [Pseudomonadota bacterium]
MARAQETVSSSRGLDTRTDRRPVESSDADISSLRRTDGYCQDAQRNLFLSAATNATSGANEPATEGADGLTDAEREQVERLKARDAEVRRHEQAHAAVGGQYASAPSYTFQQGPDGRRYAVGGEVQIDVAPVAGDPEATIEKMGVVKAAALAPAEPSAADRRVAALADAQRLQAVAE